MYTGEHKASGPARSATWALTGQAGTVGRARDHTRRFLTATAPPLTATAVGDLLVAVSELVSNAVRHAPGPCTLSLTEDPAHATVTVTVGDTSPVRPRPRTPGLTTATGGFGWHLLTSLAEQVDIRRQAGGKTVTARLAAPRETDPCETGPCETAPRATGPCEPTPRLAHHGGWPGTDGVPRVGP
ncbi:ATP-binding protein [Streptacidiphilus sp. PAMC 29251]